MGSRDPAEAASLLAVEIQRLEIPWDWIRMDIEPVTEKLLSGSSSAHSGPQRARTHTQIVLLNGQAVRFPLLVHQAVMHLPSVHQLLLCAADGKDNFKGTRKTLDGPNFMHNDDFCSEGGGAKN